MAEAYYCKPVRNVLFDLRPTTPSEKRLHILHDPLLLQSLSWARTALVVPIPRAVEDEAIESLFLCDPRIPPLCAEIVTGWNTRRDSRQCIDAKTARAIAQFEDLIHGVKPLRGKSTASDT